MFAIDAGTGSQARTENVAMFFEALCFSFPWGNMDQCSDTELFNHLLTEIGKGGTRGGERCTLETWLRASKDGFDEMWPLLTSPQGAKLKSQLQKYRRNTARRRKLRRQFGELGRKEIKRISDGKVVRPHVDAVAGKREWPTELPPAFDLSQIEMMEDYEDRIIEELLDKMRNKGWPLRKLVIEPFIGFLYWNNLLDSVDLARTEVWDALFDWYRVPVAYRYTASGMRGIMKRCKRLKPPPWIQLIVTPDKPTRPKQQRFQRGKNRALRLL
jgi:hypothetical protein